MIHTARTVRTLQAVAMIVGLAVFLWSTGLPTLFRFAEAASITDASDTLSNSAPSAVSNHTIAFELSTPMVAAQTITLTFDSDFTMGSVDEDDVDILVGGLSTSTAVGNGPGVWGVTVAGFVMTLQAPSDTPVASGTPIVIRIGKNAVDFGTGVNQITNPSATSSYPIDIGGTMTDTGQVRVAIIDQVVVSASVNTSLTFSVSGVASGQTVNGSPTTTSTTTTNVSLPFGLLAIDTSKVVAQDLLVTTNASQGYTVTVEQTGALQSTTGGTIDGFIDGTNIVAPTAWQGPGKVVTDPNTYGHWGLTSEDTNILARASQFGSDEWVSGSTTPIAIMGHNGPVLATTTRIGYQIEISALQEAGSDYTTTLRYIATPTF